MSRLFLKSKSIIKKILSQVPLIEVYSFKRADNDNGIYFNMRFKKKIKCFGNFWSTCSRTYYD